MREKVPMQIGRSHSIVEGHQTGSDGDRTSRARREYPIAPSTELGGFRLSLC